MKSDTCCMGCNCPIKNQCMRYTHFESGNVIRKCTNQKLFKQDIEKINGDSLRS